MNSLNAEYLQMLKRQVQEEISFLVSHGHHTTKNYQPCIFCYENKQHSYNCNRLNELRQFQSSIEVSLSRHMPRREIGFEVPDMRERKSSDFQGQSVNIDLPKLLQPL